MGKYIIQIDQTISLANEYLVEAVSPEGAKDLALTKFYAGEKPYDVREFGGEVDSVSCRTWEEEV